MMYNLNTNIFVIDNFYNDPVAVRKTALTCEYFPAKHDEIFKFGNAPWPGCVSKESFSPKNLDLSISRLFGKQLRQLQVLNSGRFRYSRITDTSNNVVHLDSCAYAGVLYLNDNVQDVPGTIFYTHKETKLDQADTKQYEQIILSKHCNDESYWYKNFISYIVFNRLIIYPANKFHGIGPTFGTDIESSRLIQLFFWEEL